MSPDVRDLRAFLARVARRLTWLSAAEGAAVGFALSIVLSLAGWPGRDALVGAVALGIVLAATGMAARISLAKRRQPAVALLVERNAPQCRNLLITADELLARNATPPDYVTSLVWRDAARIARTLDPALLFPGRRALALFFISVALWAFALARLAAPASAAIARIGRTAAAVATIEHVDVTITPPAYSGRAAQTTRDPSRIEALAGSRLHLSVHSGADTVRLETLRGTQTLVAPESGDFTADVATDADGYVALQPLLASGVVGTRRLIGLSVTPDEVPHVRITAPAKDLTLHDAHYTIDVNADATDDIGLSSLRLRYTKVSGSGERFTFVEGEVPLEIVRRDARNWSAHVRWSLDALALTPGDMVVYRAVAADNRPGATPSESDSFIAELAAPGGNAAPGFALDPNEDRYAVSQQMVILKTERLLARKPSMPADAYTTEAQELAAEQRKVRAEFVFMMGGELADAPDPSSSMTELNEQAEAEGESDLAAGRMFNQGRVALQEAIRSMSLAATSLAVAELTPALPQERTALAQLERAFSRTRILLRALTEHERLDLTRRLSGTLTDVTRDVHAVAEPAADPRVTALRRALEAIASLAGTQRLDSGASGRASSLVASVLQVDASDKGLQRVASLLDSSAVALGGGHSADAQGELDRAASGLAAVLREGLSSAPARASNITSSRLDGALTDALRRNGGTP